MYRFRVITFFLFTLIFMNTYAQLLPKAELARISKHIQPYSIIGLGEAEHFRQGYYMAKFEIIRDLVESELIDVIALEASINVTALLNSYIQGETDLDLNSALPMLNEPYSLQGAGLFDAAEIVDMVNWLKNYNENNTKKVKLIGIDFQNYSIPLHDLRNDIGSDEESLQKLKETQAVLDSSFQTILDSGFMVITSPEWINYFRKAQQNVIALKENIGTQANMSLFRELEQFTTLWDNPQLPRDSMMFENLKQHTSSIPHGRTVIWAANFHLENDSQFHLLKKMGVFLKEHYSDEYFIIGITEQDSDKEPQVIYPFTDNRKYDMMIQVRKGEYCERL